jgi:uncharacterized membrane protein YgdD (TMEM256/DUF423 family)
MFALAAKLIRRKHLHYRGAEAIQPTQVGNRQLSATLPFLHPSIRDTLPTMSRTLPVYAAAIFGFLGVAAGAFGAHGLASRVPAKDLAIWETAAEYQLLHAVALLALSALPDSPARIRVCCCWIAGITIFSGSLYALVLSNVRQLGMITPLGGLCMLAGWALLVFAVRTPISHGNIESE